MILLTSESKSKPERGICEQLVELCGPTGKVQREAARGRGRTAGDPLRDAGSLGGTSEAKPGNLGLCGKRKENNVTCWLRAKAPAAFGQEVRGEPPASSPQGCTQGPQEGFGLSQRGRGGRRQAGAAAGATVGESGGLRGVTAGGCSPQRRGQGQWRHPRAQGIGAANPVPLRGFGNRRPHAAPCKSSARRRAAQPPGDKASLCRGSSCARTKVCSQQTPRGRPPRVRPHSSSTTRSRPVQGLAPDRL